MEGEKEGGREGGGKEVGGGPLTRRRERRGYPRRAEGVRPTAGRDWG